MFEYKCTNDKIDIEKEYDNKVIVQEHDDKEEIAFLQELCNRTDFYELIASEPTYYLRLLETNDTLVDLCKDYDIFFIRETASEGCKNNLRIKFKIMKEDQFTEVGFFSEADDLSSYDEFSLQCKRLLKRPITKGNNEEILKNPIKTQLEDNIFDELINKNDDIFTNFNIKVEKDNLISLNNLRECCPKEYLNDYDKMLLTLKYNKKQLRIPSKKLYEGLLEVYKNTDDDAIKYEIDTFLFTNNGHLYFK